MSKSKNKRIKEKTVVEEPVVIEEVTEEKDTDTGVVISDTVGGIKDLISDNEIDEAAKKAEEALVKEESSEEQKLAAAQAEIDAGNRVKKAEARIAADMIVKRRTENEIRRYVKQSGGLRVGISPADSKRALALLKVLGREKIEWDRALDPVVVNDRTS